MSNAIEEIRSGYSVVFPKQERFGFEVLLPSDSILRSKKLSPLEYDPFDLESICDYFSNVVSEYGAISVHDIKTALRLDLRLKERSYADTLIGYLDTDFCKLEKDGTGICFLILKDPVEL